MPASLLGAALTASVCQSLGLPAGGREWAWLWLYGRQPHYVAYHCTKQLGKHATATLAHACRAPMMKWVGWKGSVAYSVSDQDTAEIPCSRYLRSGAGKPVLKGLAALHCCKLRTSLAQTKWRSLPASDRRTCASGSQRRANILARDSQLELCTIQADC